MFSRHGIAQNSSFVSVRSAERKHSDLFDLNRFVRFLSIGHSFWGRSVEWEIQQICSNIFCYFSARLTGLYIKPQQVLLKIKTLLKCFYWRLYIKPQPGNGEWLARKSVSIGGYTSNHNFGVDHFLNSVSVSIGGYTSNHNRRGTCEICKPSVSIGGYTSNHNYDLIWQEYFWSVSIGGYTSNHNIGSASLQTELVFLLAVIHQTTTYHLIHKLYSKCFYWRLYIKPQPRVVTLLRRP